MSMPFKLTLGTLFSGPVDLLLYVIRNHELQVTEISISEIIEQYTRFIDVLEFIDCNEVGEFIATASWLLELKSSEVLPNPEETEEEEEAPQPDLVRQLLSYKKYRDASALLEERGRRWQQNYARLSNDCPPRERDLAEEPIQEVELWDLVSAFGRIIQEARPNLPTSIIYDETPIHTHMQRIQQRLEENGVTTFSELFKPGMHKTAMVGMFLASLELVRNYRVTVEQHCLFGEIWLRPGDGWQCALPDAAGNEMESLRHPMEAISENS
ncbi:MAG: segregation/condensation protein A [Planctomycetia bacterium]|nr:segregation/condensation protein A [Planctomycetia bacterium]